MRRKLKEIDSYSLRENHGLIQHYIYSDWSYNGHINAVEVLTKHSGGGTKWALSYGS